MTETPGSKHAADAPYGNKRYLFGICVGLLCALLALAASLIVLTAKGWDVLLAMLIGLYGCLPLLVVLLISWLVYVVRDRNRMPARAHGWIWLPTLATAMILPVADSVDSWRKDRHEQAFPPVSELHVNLTGQDLWIATRGGGSTSSLDMPMKADNAGKFVEIIRWAYSTEPLPSPVFPYRKGVLQDEFKRLPQHLGEGAGSSLAWPEGDDYSVPWELSNPIPSLDALKPALTYANIASLVQYMYYHYADHIEVVPVLRDSYDIDLQAADAFDVPVIGFNAVNMTNESIARLEVNGQGVRVGPWSMAVAPLQHCGRGFARLGLAQVEIDQPLHVRWQTTTPPFQWHEATVEVPKMPGAIPASGKPERQQVLFYFDADGRVLAERFQAIRFERSGGETRLALRFTGAPEGLSRTPPCDGALSGYDTNRVMVLPLLN